MFEIRRAAETDLPAIRQLVESILAEFSLPIDYETSDSDLLSLEEAYFSVGGTFFVAEDETGQIIGTVAIKPYLDGVKLRKMYVSPAARGQGLGQALLDGILGEARTAHWNVVYLETLGVMEAAVHLYEKAGFERIPHEAESPRCDRTYRMFLD